LSDLKFLEGFVNPYVRVSVFCKICSKEQSLKYQHTWKRHYLTHSAKEDLPNKCSVCGKGFVTSHDMRKHFEKKHAPNKADVNVKPEPVFSQGFSNIQPLF
jgi:hypothetical protein